jgi:hypothetical protein
MEIKWWAPAWAVIMAAMFAGMGYEAKTKSDCRIAFAQSNKTVDEIVKLCGK